jgi:hypothetical protein
MTSCPHLQGGRCLIAGSLIGEEIHAEPNACSACAVAKNPQAINKVTVGMALAELRRQGKRTENFMASHGRHIRPALALRAFSYAAAVAKWAANGAPVRTEQQMRILYDEQCCKCPLREPTDQPDVSYCGPCGCVISPDPSIRNKLFFATELCPEGKF